jgi:hypothetical protein
MFPFVLSVTLPDWRTDWYAVDMVRNDVCVHGYRQDHTGGPQPINAFRDILNAPVNTKSHHLRFHKLHVLEITYQHRYLLKLTPPCATLPSVLLYCY